MQNITLIASIHTESGKCNSDELYKIIESVNPEVIFEELPSHSFDKYYGDLYDKYYAHCILNNLLPEELPCEVKCIKKYRQNYNIEIVPVDIDVTQKVAEYEQEIFFLFRTFLKDENYNKLDNLNDTFIAQEGFHYLNSDKFLDYLEKKEVIEKNIMESEIREDRLLNIYKLFHAEQHDNRENAMLQNIYNYSRDNQYDRAVFLLGAGHRKSIMKKIKEYEKQSEIKLNWTMYSNK